MKKAFFALAVLICGAGCAHTSTLTWSEAHPGQVSSAGNKVMWNLSAVNRGMYLFNLIPIWSGYATRPNRHEYKIGQDTLTRAQMRRMLDLNLKKLGAERVEDVEITSTESGAFTLWIVWRRTMRATGVAVAPERADGK